MGCEMGAYQFCVGCPHMKEDDNAISCPSQFDPYDDEKCPRHAQYMSMREMERLGRMKKQKR